MNRKRPKRKPSTSPRLSPELPAAVPPPQVPRESVRAAISIWVSIHLLAIFVSFTAVVEPSSIHAQLLELLHAYLRPAHFGADDRPVYLAHGDATEQPHQLQVKTDGDWITVGSGGIPGFSVNDRRARWLSTAAMLAENDQPSLVAELLLPVALRDPSITAIRIIRLPTDLNDINAEADSPYEARVVRDSGTVSLVQLSEERLSAQARSSNGEPADE